MKGLGVSILKEKELAIVEEMGNEKAKKIWLARFADIKGFYPDPNCLKELLEHLNEKYVLKRFYAEKSEIDRISVISKEDNPLHSRSFEMVKKKSSSSTLNSSISSVCSDNTHDLKFDFLNQTTKQPSLFKKMSSETLITKKEHSITKDFTFPVVTKKSENNITHTTRNNELKTFDFTRPDLPQHNVATPTVVNNTNTRNVPTHDFTKSAKMMDDLNDLFKNYNQPDSLDQLFYQYNFATGNHMRTNTNNYQHTARNMYSNGLDCIYGINKKN